MSTTSYPAPQPIDPRIVPQPVRLHWGWVFALTILTRGYFSSIWLIVQAYWIKRVTGRQEAFWWSIVNVCVLPAVFLLAIMVGATIAIASHGVTGQRNMSGAMVAFSVFIFALILGVYVKTVFTMRRELESAPIGIPLSGPMTFFFSALYFQYNLQDYVVPDAAEVYGPLPAPPMYIPSVSLQPPTPH